MYIFYKLAKLAHRKNLYTQTVAFTWILDSRNQFISSEIKNIKTILRYKKKEFFEHFFQHFDFHCAQKICYFLVFFGNLFFTSEHTHLSMM